MERNLDLCFLLMLLLAGTWCEEEARDRQAINLVSRPAVVSKPTSNPTDPECPPNSTEAGSEGCLRKCSEEGAKDCESPVSTITPPKPKKRMPYCWNYTILKDQYSILEDGSLLVLLTGVTIPPTNFTLVSEEGPASICYPFSYEFRNCKKWKLQADEFQIQGGGLEIRDLFSNKVYKAGDFRLPGDGKVVICMPLTNEPTHDLNLPFYLYGIAWTISAVSLFIAFVVYLVAIPKLKLHDKMLLCHIVSLFIVYVLFVLRLWGPPPSLPMCMAFGILIHFTFLSAFCWINVLAFDIWKAFPNIQTNMTDMGRNVSDTFKFILHCLYAWGLPLLIVCVAISVDTLSKTEHAFKPSYKLNCWLNLNYSRLLYFYGPAAIILLSNFIFFGLTVWNLRQMGKDASLANKKIHTQLMHLYLKLIIIMGLCWIMEVVSWAVGGDSLFWYFTDAINCLQGFFLFLIYICKRNILTSLRRCVERNWLCCRQKLATTIYHTKGNSSTKVKDGESISDFNYSTSTQISHISTVSQDC